MAPQNSNPAVAQAQSQGENQTAPSPTSSGRQPFRLSALHPRAGKASSAGIAPNLMGEMAGLFEGSLTSGYGPQIGMVPTAKPKTEEPSTKPARPAIKRRSKASTEAKPKPAPRRMTAEEARAFLMGSEAPAGPNAEPRPMRTPPIPKSIRDLRLAGFTSVYELLPEEPRLFALESVYGRWDGKILVLDSAPTHVQVVKARLARRTLRPYCQHETPATYGLARLAFPLASRGVLAGTCYGPLLVNDNGRDELKRSRDEHRKAVAPMLRHVIKSMPNVKAIVCLGVTAYDFVLHAMTSKAPRPGALPRWPQEFDAAEPVRPIFGGPTVFLTCRTSPDAIHRRGGETRAQQDWQAVADHLAHQEKPRALKSIGRSKVTVPNHAA
ncbi:MAG: hypothetical protein RIE32_08105 [Phycisphaerales bacterium]